MEKTERWLLAEYLAEIYEEIELAMPDVKIGPLEHLYGGKRKLGKLIDRLVKEDE